MHESFNALMPLIIPEGVSDYFEMTHYSKEEKRLDIFLEELNNTPEEYQGQKLISKGFFEPVTLQDFFYPWHAGLSSCQAPQMVQPGYR